MKRPFKVGDTVLYDGLLATVLQVTESFYGTPMLCLEAVEDCEMTCTAEQSKCILHDA